MAGGEEIAQRRLNRRSLLIIPVYPENHCPRIAPVIGADGEPDVLDLTRTVQLSQHNSLSRLDPERISVGLRIE